MNNRFVKAASLSMAALMTMGMLTGCGASKSVGTATQNGGKVLFSYAGEDFTLEQAWLYGKITCAQYEEAYSGYVEGDIWSLTAGTAEDGTEVSMEDYVKMQTIAQIKQIYVMDQHAKDYNLELSEEEIAECETYAKAFCEDSMGKQILDECGATEEDVIKMYQDNALAAKVRDIIVDETDMNVSTEEARATTIYRVGFNTVTTNENGDTVEMSKEDKEAQLKKAKKALAIIENNEASIEQIAKEVNFENTTETFAKGESEEGPEFEEILSHAQDGDIIDGVFETPSGYVIAKLIAYTDEDATEDNMKTIISQRQQQVFFDTYAKWVESYDQDWDYNTSVDQELWSELRFGAAADSAAEGTTEQ